MELVEPHIVVALWPALLAEIDSEHEDRVDELGVAEIVSAEIVLRPDRVDPRRAGTRRPSTERDAHDLAGEAAVDELSPRRGPAVEPRIVERTLLEARALGHDLTEVGSVELAGHEGASRPRYEERSELLVETQAAEVACDEVGDGDLALVEARLPKVDVREPGAPHRDDAGLNVVRLTCAAQLGHCAPGSADPHGTASVPSVSTAPCHSR